jgi:hypothetical protein
MAKPVKQVKIPAPSSGDWKKAYGSWEGFVKEIHKSIGRNLGGGVLNFSVDKYK